MPAAPPGQALFRKDRDGRAITPANYQMELLGEEDVWSCHCYVGIEPADFVRDTRK